MLDVKRHEKLFGSVLRVVCVSNETDLKLSNLFLQKFIIIGVGNNCTCTPTICIHLQLLWHTALDWK